MKKNIIETLKKPLIFVLLQNLAFMLVSLFAFHPHFEENDDAIIAFIAEGVYGAKDSHLVYSNYCWGEVLRFLYRMCPAVRWHSVAQYFFVLIAFSAISYILVTEKKQGRLLSTFFLLCTFYEAYVSLQYTKTAAIVSVAGYLIIFYCLRILRRGEKATDGLIAAGFLLLAYGFLLRDSCFYLATGVFIVPLGYELWSIRKETETGHKKKLLLAYLAAFAMLTLVLLAFSYMNNRAYSSHEDWKSFRLFNEKRMALLDYRYDLMNYEEYGERLEQFGISENDALLYLTWQFGDKRIFNVQLMNEVLEGAPARTIDIAMLKRLAAHIYEEFYGLNVIMIGAVCLALWLLLDQKKRNRYLLLYAFLVLTAVLSYYEYSGRWNHRVVVSVVFALFALLLQYSSHDEKKPLLFVIGICVFLNCGLLLQDNFAYNAYMREEAPATEALNMYTMEQEDNLYLIDPFTDQYAYQYDVFKAYQEGSLQNRTYFGGWLIHSPIYRDVLERYGYRNAFQALQSAGTDQRIYLIDNCYPEEKLQYIEEHYGKQFTLETVGNIEKYTIYRLCK